MATTPASPETASAGPFQVLKSVAEISIVLATILFTIGWGYLYAYYHLFGLSISELSFSPQAVLTYSLPVILTKTFLLWGAPTVIGIFLLVYFLKGAWLKNLLILMFVLLAIYFGSRYAALTGRKNARQDASLQTSGLPYVKLYGTGDSDPNGGCNLEEWSYRLLLRANGQIYVVLPIDNSGELKGTNLRVCSFPETRVQAVRIQVGLETE